MHVFLMSPKIQIFFSPSNISWFALLIKMDSFTHEAITLYHQDFNVGDLIALLSGSHAAEM